MPRGGLVFPYWAEIMRVDRGAMRNQPVGDGEKPRYNDIFREPRLIDDGDGVGRIDRREKATPIHIKCQLEPKRHDGLNMMAAGNAPISEMAIVVHRRDAETAGLLDENGKPIMAVGDRLAALRLVNIRGGPGEVLEQFPETPGLYLVESTPAGAGLSLVGARINLQVLRFNDRRTSPQRFE